MKHEKDENYKKERDHKMEEDIGNRMSESDQPEEVINVIIKQNIEKKVSESEHLKAKQDFVSEVCENESNKEENDQRQEKVTENDYHKAERVHIIDQNIEKDVSKYVQKKEEISQRMKQTLPEDYLDLTLHKGNKCINSLFY